MQATHPVRFESVREWNDTFLALFPHRFDYIVAPHGNPGETPAWKTESRHPLSDRLIRQAANLYGVRFGAETQYGLLDIDAGSAYHPKRDPFAIARIVAALEPLGLVSYVACTSSYSGGLHLYFPFQQAQSSWQLAIALACLLENAGFKLQPGQLEVFPNPKPYATDGNLSLFNAHRLPLQAGSYLLNPAWQRIWSDDRSFVQQWNLAQQRNDIHRQTIQQILKQAKRKHFGISGKAEKFINDLNAEIELGWTGYGQTNRLLGRITMRAYIFHHVLSGGEPLQGKTLVNEIVETAQALPGYREWCRHQHEIEQRAEEWARCIEHSHYFHFGHHSQKSGLSPQDPELTTAIEQAPSWNQRQSAATRDRIRRAIADLLEQNTLPVKATARFQVLLNYGIGGASLYRHRDLWHPTHFNLDLIQNSPTQAEFSVSDSPVEIPPHPPSINSDSQLDAPSTHSNWLSPSSLFPGNGGDNRLDGGYSDRPESDTVVQASKTGESGNLPGHDSETAPGVQFVQQVLLTIQANQEARRKAASPPLAQPQRSKFRDADRRHRTRMQQFLDSGDPILMGEALAWAQANPGIVLTHSQSTGETEQQPRCS